MRSGPLFFAGDLTSSGSPFETRLARRIAGIGDPVVFVTGNHDSDVLARELAEAGAIVLTERGRLLPSGKLGKIVVNVAACASRAIPTPTSAAAAADTATAATNPPGPEAGVRGLAVAAGRQDRRGDDARARARRDRVEQLRRDPPRRPLAVLTGTRTSRRYSAPRTCRAERRNGRRRRDGQPREEPAVRRRRAPVPPRRGVRPDVRGHRRDRRPHRHRARRAETGGRRLKECGADGTRAQAQALGMGVRGPAAPARRGRGGRGRAAGAPRLRGRRRRGAGRAGARRTARAAHRVARRVAAICRSAPTTARPTGSARPTATSCGVSGASSRTRPTWWPIRPPRPRSRGCSTGAPSPGAAAIPFGGGTSVCGGIECPLDRPVVTVDLRALDRVLEVDRIPARPDPGRRAGPLLEEQLHPHGLTLRHFPQSFEYSTLGGWIATRAGGHFATGPTHIDDLVESVRAITPAGGGSAAAARLRRGAEPRPDADRLRGDPRGDHRGVGARARAPRVPGLRRRRVRHVRGRGAGGARARAVGSAPSNCRLLDPGEAALTGAAESGALLVLGFESADHGSVPGSTARSSCAPSTAARRRRADLKEPGGDGARAATPRGRGATRSSTRPTCATRSSPRASSPRRSRPRSRGIASGGTWRACAPPRRRRCARSAAPGR